MVAVPLVRISGGWGALNSKKGGGVSAESDISDFWPDFFLGQTLLSPPNIEII